MLKILTRRTLGQSRTEQIEIKNIQHEQRQVGTVLNNCFKWCITLFNLIYITRRYNSTFLVYPSIWCTLISDNNIESYIHSFIHSFKHISFYIITLTQINESFRPQPVNHPLVKTALITKRPLTLKSVITTLLIITPHINLHPHKDRTISIIIINKLPAISKTNVAEDKKARIRE